MSRRQIHSTGPKRNRESHKALSGICIMMIAAAIAIACRGADSPPEAEAESVGEHDADDRVHQVVGQRHAADRREHA